MVPIWVNMKRTVYSKETSRMMIQKDTQTEKRRDNIIEDLVNKGVFKIDGKQLYELNFYQLMKQYINDEKQTN